MQKEGLEKYLNKDNKVIAWPNTADGRQLIARKLMERKPDGSAYWKNKEI